MLQELFELIRSMSDNTFLPQGKIKLAYHLGKLRYLSILDFSHPITSGNPFVYKSGEEILPGKKSQQILH